MIIGIVAVDKNWGIGKDNDLLFHISEDMKFFKEKTLNHIVCMGRKTFESLPNQLPLKDRTNVVLCSNNYDYKDCICVHSLEELLSFISQQQDDVYIIGGGKLYSTMLPFMNKVYVTKVDTIKEADTFFPNLSNFQFVVSNKSSIINTKSYPIQFIEYKKESD